MKKVDTTADHNVLNHSTRMMVVETEMTAAACNMVKRSETMMKNNIEAHHEWKRGVRKSSMMTMANVAHHEWKRRV